MHLSQAIHRYLTEGKNRGHFAPTTVTSYRSILGMLTTATGDPPIVDLQRRHIARWYGDLTCSPSTTRHRLSVIQTFTAWAVTEGLITKDPAIGFKPPAQPRYLPRALPAPTVGQLLSGCPDPRARLIVLLMAQMGLRCCEVARLQYGDIDWQQQAALVRGKGSKERVVPIPREVLYELEHYLTEWPPTAGPLIRSYHDPSRGLAPGYIGDRVRLWMRAAGVKTGPRDGRSAHALRHTCATDVLRSGADVRQVQAMLGHQSLQTTQRYLGWSVDGLRTVMEGRSYLHTGENGESVA